jgi:hypothetical protein
MQLVTWIVTACSNLATSLTSPWNDYPSQEIQSDRDAIDRGMATEIRDHAKLKYNLSKEWSEWISLIGVRTFIYSAAATVYFPTILPMPMVRPILTTPLINPHVGWFIGAIGLWYLFEYALAHGRTLSLRLALAKWQAHRPEHSHSIDSTSPNPETDGKTYLRGYIKYHRVKANNYLALAAFTSMTMLTPIPYISNHLPIPAFVWGSIGATILFWYKTWYHHGLTTHLKRKLHRATSNSSSSAS